MMMRALCHPSRPTRPLCDFVRTLPQDFGERRPSCDMTPSHNGRPRNAGTLVGHDSCFVNAEAVALKFGREFGGGHVAREDWEFHGGVFPSCA